MHTIIIKPLVTEKSMSGVTKGKYSFIVARYATKSVIKQAIKALFSVTVTGVVTSVVKGKTKRVGQRRLEMNMPVWKKATVTLKKGEKIALFEPGSEEEKKDKKK